MSGKWRPFSLGLNVLMWDNTSLRNIEKVELLSEWELILEAPHPTDVKLGKKNKKSGALTDPIICRIDRIW